MFYRSNRFKDYIKTSFIKYAILLILFVFVLFFISMLINFRLVVVGTNQSYNRLLSGFIDNQHMVYDNVIRSLSLEKTIKDLLFGEGQDSYSKANNLLYDSSNGQEIRSNFVLLDKNLDIISTSLYEVNKKILREEKTMTEILANISKSPYEVYSYLNKIHFSHGQESSYLFAKAVTHENDVVGYLLLFLRNEDLKEFMRHKDVDIAVITDRYDNVIFSTNNLMIDYLGKFKLNETDNNTASIDGKPYYFSSTTLKGRSLCVLTMTDISRYRQFLVFGTIFLFVISLFTMMLVILLSEKMAKKNMKTFDSFINAIDQCKAGNIDFKIELDTYDEFQRVCTNFNNLMFEVRNLIRRNDEIAERKRLMEIKHLESQFNPHFVFNVLEMLRYEILFDPKQASNMVVSLANLMRYSIRNVNEQVTLRTDLEYVKVYLELQKMRYNTRLNYSIRVEEGLMECKVPKFIFQPIVENSIKHGIDNTKSLSIKISVDSDGSDVKITVEDDGQGIKREEIVNLVNMLRDEDPAEDCRIGLYNAHRVIRLLYGKNYGLEISSSYGIGTKVTLTIPAQEDD